jgi:thiol-disulfide isomerase/thioredoxin
MHAHRIPIVLLLAAPCLAAPQDKPAPAPAPAPAHDAAAERAAEMERLQKRYYDLQRELVAASGEYQKQVQRLTQENIPRAQWPQHPYLPYFPKIEELALRDQPDALRWCLMTVGQLGHPLPEVVARKGEYYARLVVLHADLPWMKECARWLQADGEPTALGYEGADELLAELAANTRMPANRASALAARAALRESRSGEGVNAERLAFLRELATRYPGTDEGRLAAGGLFRDEHLAVGKPLPDREAEDVDGVHFKLSDYRGKVLVLDFWGFWCGPCVRELPSLAAIQQRHADDPFVVIGVNTDVDRNEYKRRAAEAGVVWRNAWTGGQTGVWPAAWGIQKYPTIYVVDARGVIRHVDLRGEELGRAVAALVAEARAHGAGR